MLFPIDSVFSEVDLNPPQMVRDVLRTKYLQEGESFDAMCSRVVQGVYAKDPSGNAAAALAAMRQRLWMPAGRILAGAGTSKLVTLMNCYVNHEIEDSMESIAKAHTAMLLTQQQGGGIGTDFSPIRPENAWLFRTQAPASGPGPFIDMWDAGCQTVKSAGDRRGAMMTTLICTHPFLPDFIKAKHQPGRWTNTNISVLITDAFMAAVADDEDWVLHHKAMPDPRMNRSEELQALDFEDDDGVLQYVYSVHRARDLWRDILLSTYNYAEPGVIFVDRVNALNNLSYCEDISCTNPCGEQPLPFDGCCNLGAVNITRMVRNPFKANAVFSWDLLREITRIGVRFLDNVIDVTNYPLPEQEAEEKAKRRIGIGISGLADAMHMLGMRYGSPQSIEFTELVMKIIANEAYRESAFLAKEKGVFPMYQDGQAWLNSPFVKRLDQDVQAVLQEHGARNGVLLTVAPTGTTSIAYGNGSSGLEPVFLHKTARNVKQADDTFAQYVEYGYGMRLWMLVNGRDQAIMSDLPSHMNECHEVKIHEHVKIQEACQRWVDASISKTINLPEDISFEDFQAVYDLAYTSGLKGCTTYRPSDVRGSILSDPNAKKQEGVEGTVSPESAPPVERPKVIDARTVKVRWPRNNSMVAIYLTVGYVDGKPYEVFLNSKDQSMMEWTTTVTLLMTLCLRKGIPFEELAEEFKQITALEGAWVEGKYHPSLISYLGQQILDLQPPTPENLMIKLQIGLTEELELHAPGAYSVRAVELEGGRPKYQCVQCKGYNISMQGGCPTCIDCGWSKCQ